MAAASGSATLSHIVKRVCSVDSHKPIAQIAAAGVAGRLYVAAKAIFCSNAVVVVVPKGVITVGRTASVTVIVAVSAVVAILVKLATAFAGNAKL